MADKISRFDITFSGDAGDLLKVFGSIKSQAKSAAAEIEQTTSRIELFKGTQDRAEELARTIGSLSVKAAEFRQKLLELEGAGTKAPRELTDGLKETERQIARTSAAYDRQAATLARISAQLQKAGVDTSKLASEEARLAVAAKQAADAQALQEAKNRLSLKTLSDIAPQVAKANEAYRLLASSGKLTSNELAVAHQQLSARLAELRGQVTQIGDTAKSGGPNLAAMFTGSVLPALGLTASVATLVAGIKSAVDAARDYTQHLAEIGATTNLTKQQLGALGADVRRLAVELGVDLDEALRGTFELLRSGVPAGNVLEVLRVSAEASKAAVTDLGDGVKAANVLMSAFGVSVKDLGPALDAVIQGGHDGGATLKEFGESAAPLLNVARAANVPLNELVATLAVMTNASGNAGESIGALTKIITKLQTSDTRERLRALGIESSSLVDIFSGLSQRGLALEQVLDLQLGASAVKSAAGIATLTNNASLLPAELDKIKASAGLAAKTVADLYDSPRERSDRFNAQVKEARTNVGLLFGEGSKLQSAGAGLLGLFNTLTSSTLGLAGATKQSDRAFADSARSMVALVPGLRGPIDSARDLASALGLLHLPAKQAADAVAAVGAASADTVDKNDRLAASLSRANTLLSDFSTRLLEDVKALQEGASRDIADANARAQAQLAALDQTTAATRATAAATLAIQTKLAADRLAIITKAEADINAAVDKAAAARADALRKKGVEEQQIEAQTAALRIQSLAPILQQYQAHYAALVQAAQGYAAKVDAIENERVDFNRGIEKTLRDIRLSSLDTFDQYLAKVKEVEQLISKAREEGAKGDLANAKRYTQEAIALANELGEVTDKNGVKVITQLQNQTTKIDLVERAAKAYNDALGDAGDAAKKGADATGEALKTVEPKIQSLQDKYDALKKNVAEGLNARVILDEEAIAAAFKTLDDLTKPRTVVVTVKTVNESGQPTESPVPIGPSGQPLARGGFAGRALAASNPITLPGFAAGGFVRPSWNKVPGIGNADTVPARLNAGSFVVRKSASTYYGDGIMRALATDAPQRFADGGIAFRLLGGSAQRPAFSAGRPRSHRGSISVAATRASVHMPTCSPSSRRSRRLRSRFGRLPSVCRFPSGLRGFSIGSRSSTMAGANRSRTRSATTSDAGLPASKTHVTSASALRWKAALPHSRSIPAARHRAATACRRCSPRANGSSTRRARANSGPASCTPSTAWRFRASRSRRCFRRLACALTRPAARSGARRALARLSGCPARRSPAATRITSTSTPRTCFPRNRCVAR